MSLSEKARRACEALPEGAAYLFEIAGKDIVLVEDIVDTGITTNTALRYLQNYQPASLRLCTLLDKLERRQVPVKIDYLGFTVEDLFIVGYGIDFDQKYRQLPDIYYLAEADL